jgi:N-acetylmuramoyl-L-alanine amidase
LQIYRYISSYCPVFLRLFAGLVLAGFLAVAQADTVKTAKTTAIEVIAKGKTTRFYADMSSVAEFNAFVMSDPHRVLIDLANVSFDLPEGAGQKSKGLVRTVRYGEIEAGKSRIVIETDGPVQISEAKFLAKKVRGKSRLVIDLVASSQQAALASPETTGTIQGPAPIAPQPSGKKVIIIDPGHGGIDGGASSPNHVKEKDVVFAFAKTFVESLNATGRYDVRMTRDTDRFMTLSDRVEFTKASGAELFIAIHADTLRGPTGSGTTIYTLSDKASDEEAAALAEKENHVDSIAGIKLSEQVGEVADVLFELARKESKTFANLLSRNIVDKLKGVTPLTGKPIRSASFFVLKVPDVPSVLIELGFLSNPSDEKKLLDEAWRKTVSAAMTAAVDRHFAAIASKE